MNKEFWIGRDKSPSSVFKICCYKLNNNSNSNTSDKSSKRHRNQNTLTLVALEGAIVIAIDAVNMLVRENIATIDKIETSFVEVN